MPVQLPFSQFTDFANLSSADYIILLKNGVNAKIKWSDVLAEIPGGGGGISSVLEDTTPQLGGPLDVNGNKIVSVTNGDIDIEPHGTGNVLLGNFTLDADQAVGAGQDNYVLTYDNGTGLISLEVAAGGGGDVTKSGVPVDNQVGVWAGDGPLEGTDSLVFDDATKILTVGVDDTSRGIIGAYGHATGTAEGGEFRAYFSADQDTLEEYAYLRAKIDGTVNLGFPGVGDQFWFGIDGGFTCLGDITCGDNDTHAGNINVYGGQPAAAVGGQVKVWNSADHDATSQYGYMMAYEDDIRFAAQGQTNYLTWTLEGRLGVGTVTPGEAVDVVGNIAVTGTVDGINIAADVPANTAKVSNATHTGDVTGSVALTIDPTAISGKPTAAAFTSGDTFLILSGGVLEQANYDDLPGAGGGIASVLEDTTPQLGGMLDVNGQALGDGTFELLDFTETGSAVNHVNITNAATDGAPIISAVGDDPNIGLSLQGKGTGNVWLGNYEFNADQAVGAGQDNYVLTYNDATGEISLEVAVGGGTVDTSGTPIANDMARFIDADTIEGRSYAEARADMEVPRVFAQVAEPSAVEGDIWIVNTV